MTKDEYKREAEEEWLIDYMERELNQEDLRRAMMVLETTPKLRGKLNEFMLIKESLMHSQSSYRNREKAEVNFDSLHKRIMTEVEKIEATTQKSVKKK